MGSPRSGVHLPISQSRILVNNGRHTRDQLVGALQRADWDAVLQTHLTSATLHRMSWLHAHAALGGIINITSIFVQNGAAGQANYAASKAGLIGLTMAIAREEARATLPATPLPPFHRNRHDGGPC